MLPSSSQSSWCTKNSNEKFKNPEPVYISRHKIWMANRNHALKSIKCLHNVQITMKNCMFLGHFCEKWHMSHLLQRFGSTILCFLVNFGYFFFTKNNILSFFIMCLPKKKFLHVLWHKYFTTIFLLFAYRFNYEGTYKDP